MSSPPVVRVIVGVAAALVLTSPLGAGGVSARAAVRCPGVTDGTDFDGHAGGADTAIGVPGAHLGDAAGAGAVEIRFGCDSSRATQRLQLGSGHDNDHFGAALAVGQVNTDSDTDDDLVVGVPGLEVDGRPGAGGVAVFVGSPSGLRLDRVLTQATRGVPGTPRAGAHFGAAVAFGMDPFSGEPDHLRVGEPGRDVRGAHGSGGFVDLSFDDGSLVRGAETTFDSPGIPGSARSGDALGASLSAGFAVGAPGRRVSGQPGAGAVLSTWPGRAAQLITQDSPGMPGQAERGDHFGASVAGQWAGVPGESTGRLSGAGAVERWDPDDPHGRILLTQNSTGVPGASEAGDHFGGSLAELGVYVDDIDFSPRQLVVGSPGEDLARVPDAGTLTWIGEFDDPDSGPFRLTGVDGARGAAVRRARARFGTTLGLTGDTGVLVGAPGAGSGLVTVLESEDAGKPLAIGSTWGETSAPPRAGDAYGGALSLPAR